MNKYNVRFFPNGRVYFLDYDLLQEALDNDKEILIIMSAWSGGYAVAIGANKCPAQFYDEDADPDAICYEMYAYDIRDEEMLDPEYFTKFHKVIFTAGTMIFMKTGEQATAYQGGKFIDWHTRFEDFKTSFRYNGETREEFEALRFQIDFKHTAAHISWGKDGATKLASMSGYAVFGRLTDQEGHNDE